MSSANLRAVGCECRTSKYIQHCTGGAAWTLFELTQSIRKSGARRVVIDSLAGFELAMAPNFRVDFREVLYRLVAVLTGTGATVLLVSEVEDRYSDLRFSPSSSDLVRLEGPSWPETGASTHTVSDVCSGYGPFPESAPSAVTLEREFSGDQARSP